MELSKTDNRIAKIIIDRGLQKDFEQGLHGTDSILENWKVNGAAHKETYHVLYAYLKQFDKHIAQWYDGMKNADFLLIMAWQCRDGLITDEDLTLFPAERFSLLRDAIALILS